MKSLLRHLPALLACVFVPPAGAGPDLGTYLLDNSECVALYSLGARFVAREGEAELSKELQAMSNGHLDVVLLVAKELQLTDMEIEAHLARGVDTISDEVGDGFVNFPTVINKRADFCRLSVEMPEIKISMLKSLAQSKQSSK